MSTVPTPGDHRVTFSGLSDGSVEWTCRCGAGRVAVSPAAAEAEADAHALPRDEHRVIIRLDGGDYELSCTGCSLRWRAPSKRAAERTKARHEADPR
jgi:hypothetical protein